MAKKSKKSKKPVNLVITRKIARNILKRNIGSNRIQQAWGKLQTNKYSKLLDRLKLAFKKNPSKGIKFAIKGLKSYLVFRSECT